VSARWLGPLVRLAGGDPVRVLGLARALRREAQVQLQLAHEAGTGGRLGPDAGRWVMLGVLGAMSIAVAAAVGALRERAWVAASLLVLCQGGAVFLTAARDAVPLILGQEDRRVLGWWPVSERELLLARSGLLLRAVLEASAAMTAAPLVVLLVAGAPPVAAGLGTLVGLGLHAVVLAAVLAILVQGLARLIGRARARRLVEVAGTLLIVIVINLAARRLGTLAGESRLAGGWALAAVPTAWFGAWGALAQPGWPEVAAAGMGLAAAIAVPAWGLRALGSRGRGDRESTARSRRAVDWTRPLGWWLAPWLRGRDGRALGLLARAHLREDWRLTGGVLFLPVLLLAYLAVSGDRLAGATAGTEAIAGRLALWMALLGASLGGAFTCSSEAAAAWLPAGGVGDPRRLLSLERRLARALLPAPALLAIGIALWAADLVRPADLPAVLGIPWLAFELTLTLTQLVGPAAPFSRAWRRDGGGANRAVFWLLLLVAPACLVWNALVIARTRWGLALTAALLAGSLAGVRWSLARRIGRHGLPGLSPRRA